MFEGGLFQNTDKVENKDVKAILLKYFQYWYLFLAGLIICVGLAFLHMRYNLKSRYDIVATILIKDVKGSSASSAFSDLGVLNTTKSMDNEIILLKSKSLMLRVLKELSYHTSYYKKGRVQDVEIFEGDLPFRLIISKLEPSAYGKTIALTTKANNLIELEEKKPSGEVSLSTYKLGQQVNKPYAVFTVVEASDAEPVKEGETVLIKFNNIQSSANKYSSALAVTQVSKSSSALSISLSDPVRDRGLSIVSKLIEVYESEAVEDKNKIASTTLNFIDERLEYLTAELTNVEKDEELYKKQNSLTDVSSEAKLYLSSASEYNKQLAEFDIQLELLNSIESYLQKQGDQFELVPSSLNIQDPTLLSLITKFNELQLHRQRVLRSSQPDHPLVININEQLANLRGNIKENLRTIKSGLMITRQNLMASSARFESRKKQVPVMERELLEINRQKGVKEGLYLYLLQKREESALSLAATVSSSKVIDAPDAKGPIGPNKSVLYLMAVLLGLGVPFAFLYIKELMNDKIQGIQDIERFSSAPVLGEISHDRSREFVVVKQGSWSIVAEMFRMVRAKLHFAMLDKENKVILVTSSMSGEGKTFFGINLASSLALTGKNVLVIDLDLRRPRLSEELEISEEIGISEFVSSNAVMIHEIIRTSEYAPGLFVIGAGAIPSDPSELMLSPKITYLLNELKQNFDHIILDTPPIGLVSDAFSLSKVSDSTIYLMRHNYTLKKQLNIVEDIARNNMLPNPMIVLNDIKLKNQQGYGYGYAYGGKEEKKKVKKKAVVK